MTVQLCVDGVPVAETTASQPVANRRQLNGGYVGFRFGMERVWSHLTAGQELSVVADGHPLEVRPGRRPEIVDAADGSPVPVTVEDHAVTVTRDGARSEERLLDLIASGKLINKKGRIQAPIDVSNDWASLVMPEYERLERLLHDNFGKRPYVFYGAMLGFAREGGIMAHDLDLDLAYLSDETDPHAVREEFATISRRLIEQHPRAKPFSYKLQFPGRKISLTPTWFTDGVFYSTFGFVGDGFTVERGDILPLRSEMHAGTRLWLPNRPENVARYLYGRGWKYPDRGWVWRERYLSWPTGVAARLSDDEVKRLAALRRRTRRSHDERL